MFNQQNNSIFGFNGGGGCSGCFSLIGGLVVLFFVLSICGALVN